MHTSDRLDNKLTWFVFQFHNCLHATVVIIYVDSSHHLASLQVTNAQCNLTDSMATNKLYYLCGCCELGVNLSTMHYSILQTNLSKTLKLLYNHLEFGQYKQQRPWNTLRSTQKEWTSKWQFIRHAFYYFKDACVVYVGECNSST
jgi:hypothetical protein